MAAAAPPPALIPVPVEIPAGAATQQSPIFIPAAHPMVAATPFLPWQNAPAPAGGGPAQVSLPLYAALKAFISKARVAPDPASQTAARVSVFRARFTIPFWSNLLGEYHRCGLFDQPSTTSQQFEARLRNLVVVDPTQLNIVAAAWNLAPDFVIPGGNGAAVVYRRALMEPIRFIHLTRIDMLQDGNSSLPLSRFAMLAGCLGGCYTEASREEETGLVQASALLLREACGDENLHDGGRARALPTALDRITLPVSLRTARWTADLLGLELADGILFRGSSIGQSNVIERRIHCVGSRSVH